MEPIYVSSVPDLESATCPDCGGSGRHDDGEEGKCDTCDGHGEIGVCPDCWRVPTLVQGLEVCACTIAVFTLDERKAA